MSIHPKSIPICNKLEVYGPVGPLLLHLLFVPLLSSSSSSLLLSSSSPLFSSSSLLLSSSSSSPPFSSSSLLLVLFEICIFLFLWKLQASCNEISSGEILMPVFEKYLRRNESAFLLQRTEDRGGQRTEELGILGS